MLAALLAFIEHLHRFDGRTKLTCIMVDNADAPLVQPLLAFHYQLGLSVYLIDLRRHTNFPENAWVRCAQNRAIAILERNAFYAQLIADIRPAAGMQTVLISSRPNGLTTLNVSSSSARLLYIEAAERPAQASEPQQQQLQMYVWKQGVRICGTTAEPVRPAALLWNRGPLRTQLFWGNVTELSLMPVFRAKLVPPLYISACHPSAPGRCFVAGPHVFIMKQIIERLTNGSGEKITLRPAHDASTQWYRSHSFHEAASNDFIARRNVRDAVLMQSDLRHNSEQSLPAAHAGLELEVGSIDQSSRAMSADRVVLVVPQRRNYFRSKTYVNLVRLTSVAACIMIAMLVAAVQNGRIRLTMPYRRRVDFSGSIFDAFAQILGNSTSAMPTARQLSKTDGILLSTLAFLAIMLAAFMSGDLMVKLVNNITVSQIESFKELRNNTDLNVTIAMESFPRAFDK